MNEMKSFKVSKKFVYKQWNEMKRFLDLNFDWNELLLYPDIIKLIFLLNYFHYITFKK